MWDLTDEKAKQVPAGVYFLRLTGNGIKGKISAEKRLVVLR